MKKTILYLLLLMLISSLVLAFTLPPPPPTPGGFGSSSDSSDSGTERQKKPARGEALEIDESDLPPEPAPPGAAPVISTTSSELEQQISELEKRISKVEMETSPWSLPILFLIAINVGLFGLTAYLLRKLS